MPLHLLSKKSWNVYAPANIERVKRDEAAAAAREAATEQRLQGIDAQRRLAILRGEAPPPLPPAEDNRDDARHRRRDHDGSGRDRKRRRLVGEDDTDRDIRLAKENSNLGDAASTALASAHQARRPTSDAPLTDQAGHINLFPIDARAQHKAEKNKEAEAEAAKKRREFEDQYTMRFSNAAGKGGLEKPWYATGSSKRLRQPEDGADMPAVETKDVWGNEDLRRQEREKLRMSASDPLAFMQKAQVQLKAAERDRMKWAEERAREARELKRLHDGEKKRERRHKPSTVSWQNEDDIEELDLDAPYSEERHDRSERHRPSRPRHHRVRSRSHERRHSESYHDRRERSRSRERKKGSSHSQKSLREETTRDGREVRPAEALYA